MSETVWWITAIGFSAQAFFCARIFVQWFLSERAKQVLSPTAFWLFSLIGAYLLCIYGWLRHDFSIVFGQLITYYIYIWNLNKKNVWRQWHALVRCVLLLTPALAVAGVWSEADAFFRNDSVPPPLIAFDSLGQIIFTFRFVYQLWYSSRRGESVLPAGFWILSLVGSMMIVTYGIFRNDWVLILGQSAGLFSYTRNLIIGRRKVRN